MKGESIKAWGQWSEDEEEEDEGRDKWEYVSAAIEFGTGENGNGGRWTPCRRQIELERVCVWDQLDRWIDGLMDGLMDQSMYQWID